MDWSRAKPETNRGSTLEVGVQQKLPTNEKSPYGRSKGAKPKPLNRRLSNMHQNLPIMIRSLISCSRDCNVTEASSKLEQQIFLQFRFNQFRRSSPYHSHSEIYRLRMGMTSKQDLADGEKHVKP